MASLVTYETISASTPHVIGPKTIPPGTNLPIAVLTINSPPVNALSLDVWQQLLDGLDKAENDPKIRAIIITSALDGINGRGKRAIFTSGNDINEILATKTSRERYSKFWYISNYFVARLLKSPLVTVAAIRGACPAGGTCIALCCDYRILTDDSLCGLNEVALGISVPQFWVKQMTNIIGFSNASKFLLAAKSFDAKTAFEIGFANEIVVSKGKFPESVSADLRAKSEKAILQYIQFPDPGRIATKLYLNGKLADEWMNKERLLKEADGAYNFLESPSTIKALTKYLTALGGNKKKGPSL